MTGVGQLSLELRAAMFIAMRSEYEPGAAEAVVDAAMLSSLETLVFLGLVVEVAPMSSRYRLTAEGWRWVIETGRSRGEGLAGDTLEERWIWTTLGDVLAHLDDGGEAGPARGVGGDRWRRGVCASRARAARRSRRHGRESGRGGA